MKDCIYVRYKWRFVTMFFSLDDAYVKRSAFEYNTSAFYLDRFRNLNKLGIELLVYTDEATETILKPLCSCNVTFVRGSLNALHAMSHMNDVERICEKKGNIDSRNIPEWALLTCSKVQVLNEVAEMYSDDILCWVDFGIYRPEHDYVDYSADELAEAFQKIQNSDVYKKGTIHMGVIDWVSSVEELYRHGGACTMCGQLFFGDCDAIKVFSDKFYKQLSRSIQNETFHADEQIYYELLRHDPSMFTLFATDYFIAPFNVIMPTKRLFVSESLLFPNLLKDQECGNKVLSRFITTCSDAMGSI